MNNNDWFPIESAPKEGVDILVALYSNEDYVGQAVANFLDGEWYSGNPKDAAEALNYEPKFWRHLPPPPVSH